MSTPRRSLLLVLACTVPGCTARAATAIGTEALTEGADAIFARWNNPDSPGCVCAVIRDGRIVHVRGYGMADLEHAAPLASKSVFYSRAVGWRISFSSDRSRRVEFGFRDAARSPHSCSEPAVFHRVFSNHGI